MLTVGVDMIEIDRIEGVIGRRGQRFLERVYTPGELAYCRGRVPELAARFAAKEAVAKALGTGIRGLGLARHGSRARSSRQADRRLARSRRSTRAGAWSLGVGHLAHPCARLRGGDGGSAVAERALEPSLRRKPQSSGREPAPSFPRKRQSTSPCEAGDL